jgi:Ca2+-binding RTX toxin-like protein
LDGKAGADAMTGGGGNDLYIIDNAGDTIIEGTGQGTLDVANTSISYSLAAGVQIESLATTSAGATTAVNLTGNEFSQSITGNAGANIIDGKGGADAMAGGAGNDVYYVDNIGDTIAEAANQGTLDQVAASISYTLAAGVQVESLNTTSASGTGVLDLTGNEFAQSITGNAGANILNGKGGIDTLTGGVGADFFDFNTALGASNIDRITDFDVVQDKIRLDDLIFTMLPSQFTADQFAINATGLAQDSSDRIIYQTTTGYLFYDSNGTAAGGATQFATLTANLAVTFSDFVVV